jgi:hypothetical protein
MPTIIDSLIIELGIDPTKFEKGRRDVDVAFKKTKDNAEQIAKDIEQSGKKSASFFSQITKEASALFLAFEAARGIKNFIADLKDTNAALGYAAKTLDMSTESLSTWQAVAKMAGGTAEGITGVFQTFTQAVQQFLTNPGSVSGDMRGYMAALKITFDDLKDSDKIILKLADAVKGMDPARAKNYLKNLGVGDEATINLILRGRQEIQRLHDEAVKLGQVTKEDARAAQEWVEASSRLSTEMQRLGTVVATLVTTAVKSFNNQLIGGIENSKKYTEQDWDKLKPTWERIKTWWEGLWKGNDTTYKNFIDNIKKSGPDVLAAYKTAFNAVFDWIKEQFNIIWMAMFGHKIFEGAVGGGVPGGRRCSWGGERLWERGGRSSRQ